MAWGKSLHNPILQNPSGLVGFGHGTLFKDKEGVLRYASTLITMEHTFIHASCTSQRQLPIMKVTYD
ncbi:MAG: hypothetical protein SPJ90_05635 [Prevotella sp.]|nr:hypothetical protein [Prevotellaceae bacterium]MDY5843895.1 hypothetical protein [Prevotella sp.]